MNGQFLYIQNATAQPGDVIEYCTEPQFTLVEMLRMSWALETADEKSDHEIQFNRSVVLSFLQGHYM